MILKYPISIPDFLSTCQEMEHKPCFELVLSDLLYEHGVLQPEPFGLQGIRKVIEVYEQSLSFEESSSKKEMPFFREHQLRLIGPELVPFSCSLYEESTSFTPAQNDLWISLDSEDLIDLCLGENLSLVCCKYDENEMQETFEPLLKQEYDKILFDEENTGFLPGSRFVSLLYKKPDDRMLRGTNCHVQPPAAQNHHSTPLPSTIRANAPRRAPFCPFGVFALRSAAQSGMMKSAEIAF